MKTNYIITVTRDGRRPQTLDTCDNIEDARDWLDKLLYSKVGEQDDYYYFPSTQAAKDELAYAIKNGKNWTWPKEWLKAYKANLREGIKSGTPFCMSRIEGDVIDIKYDGFSFDVYTYRIEEVEVEDEDDDEEEID